MPLAPSASSSSAASPTIGSCVRGTSAAAPADQVATFREQALRAAVEALRDEPVFWSAKQAVKEELKAQYQSTGVQEALSKVLRATGAATALKSLALAGVVGGPIGRGDRRGGGSGGQLALLMAGGRARASGARRGRRASRRSTQFVFLWRTGAGGD